MELQTMKVDDTFVMPWRKPGMNAGRITHIGPGSATVHIPKTDGDGWDTLTVSLGTWVEPCDPEVYHSQGFGDKGTGGRMKNRSTIKKPVDIVWGMCKDMPGASRDEIVEACVALGVNINTARTQFYKWRKNH